jgi:hypothetical protein
MSGIVRGHVGEFAGYNLILVKEERKPLMKWSVMRAGRNRFA